MTAIIYSTVKKSGRVTVNRKIMNCLYSMKDMKGNTFEDGVSLIDVLGATSKKGIAVEDVLRVVSAYLYQGTMHCRILNGRIMLIQCKDLVNHEGCKKHDKYCTHDDCANRQINRYLPEFQSCTQAVAQAEAEAQAQAEAQAKVKVAEQEKSEPVNPDRAEAGISSPCVSDGFVVSLAEAKKFRQGLFDAAKSGSLRSMAQLIIAIEGKIASVEGSLQSDVACATSDGGESDMYYDEEDSTFTDESPNRVGRVDVWKRVFEESEEEYPDSELGFEPGLLSYWCSDPWGKLFECDSRYEDLADPEIEGDLWEDEPEDEWDGYSGSWRDEPKFGSTVPTPSQHDDVQNMTVGGWEDDEDDWELEESEYDYQDSDGFTLVDTDGFIYDDDEVVDEPASVEQVTNEPASDKQVTDEPASVEQVTDEPASDKPKAKARMTQDALDVPFAPVEQYYLFYYKEKTKKSKKKDKKKKKNKKNNGKKHKG